MIPKCSDFTFGTVKLVWGVKLQLAALGWKISFIIVTGRLFFYLKKFNRKWLNFCMIRSWNNFTRTFSQSGWCYIAYRRSWPIPIFVFYIKRLFLWFCKNFNMVLFDLLAWLLSIQFILIICKCYVRWLITINIKH